MNREACQQLVADIGMRSSIFRILPGNTGASSPSATAHDGLEELLDIELSHDRRRLRLMVAARATVHPKQVVSTLVPLAAVARVAGRSTLPVLVAPYVSPRVAEVCRDHGVGYVDAAGNAHLVADGLCLHIEGRPNRAPDTRPAERLFAPKSSRVVRVILEEPDRTWKVQDLARTAKVSMGLASRIKRKLVEQAYAQEVAPGIRVADPTKLLRDWASAYKLPKVRLAVYGMDDPAALERAIVRWGESNKVTCALTELSAASRLAPMVRNNRAVTYVLAPPSSEAIQRLLRDLALKEVDSGPTGELWLTDDESVLWHSRDRDGVRVVSPLQAYLDTQKNPARGEEAAEELFRRWIEPRFTGRSEGA